MVLSSTFSNIARGGAGGRGVMTTMVVFFAGPGPLAHLEEYILKDKGDVKHVPLRLVRWSFFSQAAPAREEAKTPTWRRACRPLARMMESKGRLNVGKRATDDNAASNVARIARASSIRPWRLCLKAASAPDKIACRDVHMQDMARELSNADAHRTD